MIIGKKISSIEIRYPKMIKTVGRVSKEVLVRLSSQRDVVENIYLSAHDRRGLDFPFADGDAKYFYYQTKCLNIEACPCFLPVLIRARLLFYEDVRKFGTMELLVPDL